MLKRNIKIDSENKDKIKGLALDLLSYKDTVNKKYDWVRKNGITLLALLGDSDSIPILEEIVNEYAGKLKIAKLNIDENPAIPRAANVFTGPALIQLTRIFCSPRSAAK